MRVKGDNLVLLKQNPSVYSQGAQWLPPHCKITEDVAYARGFSGLKEDGNGFFEETSYFKQLFKPEEDIVYRFLG